MFNFIFSFEFITGYMVATVVYLVTCCIFYGSSDHSD